MNNRTKKLAYTALFTALVCVLTLFTHIPLPLFNARYVHLGDAAIFTAGILCGPFAGAFAAGVGSSLADLLGGAAVWAVPTLVIKTAMGFLIGRFANHHQYVCIKNVLWMLAAGIVMALGYTLTEILIFGISPWVELLTVHFYFIQFGSGIAASLVILFALQKMNFQITRTNIRRTTHERSNF